MKSNSRCMRLAQFGVFGRASIAAGTRLVCLAKDERPDMTRRRQRPYMSAILACMLCASGTGAVTEPQDSAQAKAKLAAVRARIAELTNRMRSQLAQRDSLSARVRDTELVIAATRERVEELHAAEVLAERRRSELRAEQTRNQGALQAERESLANQARAAYMIGRQEELKLLLNQSNPANLGRTLTYY